MNINSPTTPPSFITSPISLSFTEHELDNRNPSKIVKLTQRL